MECGLNDCAKRKSDNSYAIDIINQLCKFPGLIINGNTKIIERDNNKLEIQYTMLCKQCSLPVAYRHKKNISQCKRIFALFDSISTDPTCFQNKIEQLKQTLNMAKSIE